MQFQRSRLITSITSKKSSIYIITIIHLLMVGIVLCSVYLLLSGKIEGNTIPYIILTFGYFLCSLFLICFVYKNWKNYSLISEEYFYTDKFTHLPNVSAFIRDFDKIKNENDNSFVKMILIETTNQNEINSIFGLSAVYEMQKEIARYFKELLNTQIKIYKIDLNALLVLLPPNYLFDFLEIKRPAQMIRINNTPVFFEIACGGCEYPRDGKTATELLQRMSCAMQEAKQHHKVFHEYDQNHRKPQRALLLGQLQEAMNAHEIIFYYQPIMDTDGNITEMEALARWMHPQFGMLPPSSFISDMELTGISPFLTDYSLDYNLNNLRNLKKGGFNPKMAINVSVIDLQQKYFCYQVLDKLERNKLQPSDLILEITERGLLTEDEKINRNINELFKRGVVFHIDDFGVGFASFGNLRKTGMRSIKIDHSFIKNLLDDKTDQALVDCLIKMAKVLGISTIAEGVESLESIDLLKKMQVDYLQGFAIARPMPFDKVYAWLKHYRK